MKLPGTDSRAVQNPDGTWDVFDVPIVSDGSITRFNRDGEVVDEWATNAAWFDQIIQAHRAKFGEGYMGRGFIDHHRKDGSQPDMGFIMPTRVGRIQAEGDEVDALFADLVNIPDDVYGDWVRTGRVPYRSIESLQAETGWLDGLAFMPTKPPHYHLPMLTIGEEVPYDPDGLKTSPADQVEAVACASKAHARRIFAEAPMDKDDSKPTGDSKPEGGDGPPKDKPKSESGWKSKLQAIRDEAVKAEQIPDFLAELQALVADLGGEPAGGMGGEEPPPPPSPVPEQPEEDMLNASKDSAAIIRAEARADIAEADAAAARKETSDAKLVASAQEELSRFHPMLRAEDKLREKLRLHGEAGLALYVDAIKAGATPTPNPGEQDAPIGAGDADEYPDEVMQITDPDDRAVAIKAYRRREAQVEAGWSPPDLKGMIRRDLAKAKAAQ